MALGSASGPKDALVLEGKEGCGGDEGNDAEEGVKLEAAESECTLLSPLPFVLPCLVVLDPAPEPVLKSDLKSEA
jgi:hypothetical protein